MNGDVSLSFVVPESYLPVVTVRPVVLDPGEGPTRLPVLHADPSATLTLGTYGRSSLEAT